MAYDVIELYKIVFGHQHTRSYKELIEWKNKLDQIVGIESIVDDNIEGSHKIAYIRWNFEACYEILAKVKTSSIWGEVMSYQVVHDVRVVHE